MTDAENNVDGSRAEDDQRYQSILNRHPAPEPPFLYGVITTGIYCRPGCRARTPNRENVVYFDSTRQAEQQGYRPCKKCRPQQKRNLTHLEQKIIVACRCLERADVLPSLEALALAAGYSPAHFHRFFKKTVGITPRQYYLKHRSDRLRESLAAGTAVGEAIYAAGFESLSAAYNRNDDRLSMTPKNYQRGGEGIRIVYGTAACYLGIVLVAATDRGICAVELGDSDDQLHALLVDRFPNAQIERGGRDLEHLIAAVVAHVENPVQGGELPLDIKGTAFQQLVWAALRRIEPGKTTNYSEIARQIGRPAAVRAVAGACGANRIAVLIPCHRVLTKDGKISGYRWGVARKQLLLDKEKRTGPDKN